MGTGLSEIPEDGRPDKRAGAENRKAVHDKGEGRLPAVPGIAAKIHRTDVQ